MPVPAQKAILRVLDANLNRSREGLRVCEEVARLVLNRPVLTRRCQRLRYGLEAAAKSFPQSELLSCRDARGDVGRPARRGPVSPHRWTRDLVRANLRRVQEALRVLEEFSRLGGGRADRFAGLRFQAYTLEQAFDSALSSLRHP